MKVALITGISVHKITVSANEFSFVSGSTSVIWSMSFQASFSIPVLRETKFSLILLDCLECLQLKLKQQSSRTDFSAPSSSMSTCHYKTWRRVHQPCCCPGNRLICEAACTVYAAAQENLVCDTAYTIHATAQVPFLYIGQHVLSNFLTQTPEMHRFSWHISSTL